MKTSNKILLTGLAVILAGILALLILVKFSYNTLPFELSGEEVTKEIPVTSIASISASDKIKLVLDTTLTDKVVVTADSSLIEYIKVVQMNNHLSLYSSMKYQNKTRVQVHVPADSITAIDADKGCIIESQAMVNQPRFSLSLNSGSQGHLDFKVENLRLSLDGGSKANLTGNAGKAKVTIGSGSRLDARDLELANIKITGNSGGVASVWVTKEMDVDINSGSVIRYYGQPRFSGNRVSSGARLISKN